MDNINELYGAYTLRMGPTPCVLSNLSVKKSVHFDYGTNAN